MKKSKSIILFILLAFATSDIFSQANPSVGILPLNAGGVVAMGATMDIRVTINNTLAGSIPAAKLRPNITVPAIATILPDAQQTGLPAGWVIVSNAAGQIRVCNASDVVGGGEQRDIIIKVQGATIGGPTPTAVQIGFGGATCAVTGPQPSGNLTADDNASSSITVIAAPLPLTLLSFNASLLNCQPSLTWVTESEINSDRFQIERNDISNTNAGWKTVGEVTAAGTVTKSTYKFADANLNATSARVFYRLKMIDKDGSYKYSDVLPVVINCKTILVHVYPNPVQDGRLYVSVTGTNGKTAATLMSISGQVISKNKVTNGTNILDVSAVPNGSYVLNVKDANGVDKKVKVIIQR